MSGYTPRDPFGPDRDPNRRYRDIDYTTAPSDSTGTYVLMGIMAVAVLAAGILFFGSPRSDRVEQARLPESTMTVPATPTPAPAPDFTPSTLPRAPAEIPAGRAPVRP